jgi:hypothetical protein
MACSGPTTFGPSESTLALARFVAGTDFDDLPGEAVRAAKRCLLDTLGVMLFASSTELGHEIRDFVVRSAGGGPPTSLIGFGDRSRVHCSTPPTTSRRGDPESYAYGSSGRAARMVGRYNRVVVNSLPEDSRRTR